jgi:hypothetical protein
MPKHYILKDNQPVEVENSVSGYIAWAIWMAEHTDERQLALDRLPDGTHISTVFLGVDLNYANSVNPGSSPPILYETMVFMGENALCQCYHRSMTRYATRESAYAGHQFMLGTVISAQNLN